jgi:hypothetical protein
MRFQRSNRNGQPGSLPPEPYDAPAIEEIEPVRADASPAHAPRHHSPLLVEQGSAESRGVYAGRRDELEKVGGRRLVRGELVAIAVGVVFLATAILKPWTDHAAPIQPAPSKALAIVVSPSPSPAASSDLTPWRDGELPRSSGDPFPLFGEVTRLWPTVDWALIGAPNPHPAWGIATVAMTDLTGHPDATAQAAPTASWVEASPAAPVVVEVPGGQHVYAFAVTWPDRVAVTGLTFEYDGGPTEPPYVSSGVFPPYQELDPLPADVVAARPGQAVITGSTIGSGQYWVPPAEAFTLTYSQSATSIWRRLPWAWPIGVYKIRLETATGPILIVLRIDQRV